MLAHPPLPMARQVGMHTGTISLDSESRLGGCFYFARELDYYANHDRVIFDMSKVRTFSPFSMLFISSKLKCFCEKNPGVELVVKGTQPGSYAGHMGFFRMFGHDDGRNVGEAWGNERYLPITCIKREQFYEQDMDRWTELPDLIQRQADRLADILTRDRQANPDMFSVLAYCIREIMRNVFEHSRADKVYFCAQYWPKSNKVELAIADFGIGIRRGLSENPNFAFSDYKTAIEYALLPSVSGKTHLPRRSENWFNSGYGLYMTNRLARNGGSFTIASGLGAIHLGRRSKTNFQTAFPGTIIKITLDIDSLGNVESKLHTFREDGYKLAKTIAGTGNRPPSAMSLLLRRDFSGTLS